jgi:hypothetical protein
MGPDERLALKSEFGNDIDSMDLTDCGYLG